MVCWIRALRLLMASAVGVPVAAVPRATLHTSASPARLRLLAYPQLLIGGVAFALLLVGALFGPLVVPYGPIEADFTAALTGPSASHVLGTDQLGAIRSAARCRARDFRYWWPPAPSSSPSAAVCRLACSVGCGADG